MQFHVHQDNKWIWISEDTNRLSNQVFMQLVAYLKRQFPHKRLKYKDQNVYTYGVSELTLKNSIENWLKLKERKGEI